MVKWLFRGAPALSAPLALLRERKGMHLCEQGDR